MKLNIRMAETKDLQRITKLLNQVLMVHHNARPDLFKANCRKYTDGELIEIIKDKARPVLVAVTESDVVVGYAFCEIREYANHNIFTDRKTLYIDDLCVDEECRGCHVGTFIYNNVIEYAKSINCNNIELNVWSGNDNAIRFYEKCGFKVQKTGMEIKL